MENPIPHYLKIIDGDVVSYLTLNAAQIDYILRNIGRKVDFTDNRKYIPWSVEPYIPPESKTIQGYEILVHTSWDGYCSRWLQEAH